MKRPLLALVLCLLLSSTAAASLRPAPTPRPVRGAVRLVLHAEQFRRVCVGWIPAVGALFVNAWVDQRRVQGYVSGATGMLFSTVGTLVEVVGTRRAGPLCVKVMTWARVTHVTVTYLFRPPSDLTMLSHFP